MKLSGEMRDGKDDRQRADLGVTNGDGMGYALGKLRSKSYLETISMSKILDSSNIFSCQLRS
jgi:hypothetical protein